MARQRHLSKAPITEALIDWRVKARADLRAEDFESLKQVLVGRFPKVDERRGMHARFEIVEGEPKTPLFEDLGFQGYFFKSDDELTIAQFRVDGFTLNRLRPYTSWGELFPLALDLWRHYVSVAEPEVVVRLAVRYINHVPLPQQLTRLDAHLTAAPAVPPGLPHQLVGFLTRLTINDASTGISAHVAQAVEPAAGGQNPALILDIDAFKADEFEANDPVIETTFADLRAFKNLVFFNSLTEETLEQFQ